MGGGERRAGLCAVIQRDPRRREQGPARACCEGNTDRGPDGFHVESGQFEELNRTHVTGLVGGLLSGCRGCRESWLGSKRRSGPGCGRAKSEMPPAHLDEDSM